MAISRFDFYWKFVERPRRIVCSFFSRTLFRRNNELQIAREIRKYKNQLVLMGWEPEISRLIGWTEDPDDYYYVVQRRNGEIRLHSCVGGFVRLRDRLSGFEYEMVMNQWGRESIEDAMKKITEMKIVLK